MGSIAGDGATLTRCVLTLRFLSCLCSSPCAACWTLSNITAGNHEQIAQCIDSGCMKLIMEILLDDHVPTDIQQEAAWCMNNAITGGSLDQIVGFVNGGVLGVLSNILEIPSAPVVRGGLESLTRILNVGKDLPPSVGVLSDPSEPNPFVAPARKALLKNLKYLRDCGNNHAELAALVEFFPEEHLDKAEGMQRPFGARRDGAGSAEEESEGEEYTGDVAWQGDAVIDDDDEPVDATAATGKASRAMFQPAGIAQTAAGAGAGTGAGSSAVKPDRPTHW